MKKHLYLFCALLLIGASVFAQPQLSFKFAKPKIEFFSGLGNYLVFDIEVKSDQAGYYLYSSALSMEYNSSAFDVTNVLVFKGTLLNGTFQYGPQVLPKYADPFTTLNSGKINVSTLPGTNNYNANPASPASRFNEVPTEWVSLVTLWVLIDNPTEVAGVYFFEPSMNGQIFHTSVEGATAFLNPNLYETPTLESCNLERIYSEVNGWTQYGGTLDWSASVNTTIFDGNATITQADNTAALANNLNIMTGASLNLGANKWLTVASTMNSQATDALIINDGGSLIHNSSLVNATLKRNITGGSLNPTTHRYHLVSVPMDAASVFNAGNVFMGIHLWELNAISQDWLKITDSNFPINNKEGYLIWHDQLSHTLEIAGILNGGDYNLPAKTLGLHTDGQSYRLLPNPYPSAIEWSTPTGYDAAVYFYNGATGNYQTFADGVPSPAIVPSGQSFFVKKSVPGGSASAITISNSSRLHNNQALYKSTNAVSNLLQIKVSSEISEDNAYIRFHEEATNLFDPDKDARKLTGFGDAPQLYTSLEGINYAINTLEMTSEPIAVPLHFTMSMDGMVNMEIAGLESFTQGRSVFLEDVLLNEVVDINEQAVYSFQHQQNIPADRFILHFNGMVGIEAIASETIKMHAINKRIYIHLPSGDLSNATVEIFDQMGRTVYHQIHASDNPIVINANSYPHFLIVKVKTASHAKTSKLIIQ
ncbi:MAG: hypothetical protein M0Q90_06285 [Bacteroidales bacterium]|nr:hypothetical protein [Bacteroidales bacterium]